MDSWNAVYGFEELSFCDWPGRTSSVLFTGGCNFRCPTCHNWQLATNPQREVENMREVVMPFLTARKGWLDGVVISGGEPTIVPGLTDLVSEIRGVGFEINLNTNGLKPAVVRTLLKAGLVDVFSVDVKGPWQKYPALTGDMVSSVDAQSALSEIFTMAHDNPEKFYFRTTVVPGLTKDDLKECKSYLPFEQVLHEQKYQETKRS